MGGNVSDGAALLADGPTDEFLRFRFSDTETQPRSVDREPCSLRRVRHSLYLLSPENTRMNCLPLVLYLMFLLDSALGSLPAPVNLSISSVNFDHVLRWDPGPGTPPGTQYTIFRVKGNDKRRHSTSMTTSVQLTLKRPRGNYFLSVQATYNRTLSPESPVVNFSPFKDTIIGPPELSLAGCGDCIQVNISLPEAHWSSGINNNDMHAFYSPQYKVLWKKHGGAVEKPYDTEDSSFTLPSLQNDTEYCVQVHTTIHENKNTKPSAWECTFTSDAEPSRVFRSLPAPVNLSVSSFNFRHVLSWDPGPGTPPGTQYTVFKVVDKTREELAKSATTSVTLKLKHPSELYYLTVRASYNHSMSGESRKCTFYPSESTKIGRPKLSLAGCGKCIQINISLPDPDRHSGIKNFHEFYYPRYRILWKKREGREKPQLVETRDRSYTLPNLQKGVEYCFQVETSATLRVHVETSAWECTFTSIVEPSRGPVIVRTVAAVLICVGVVLMASMFCLYYTGFICNLKETLPRALVEALMSRGYTLTPEQTLPDHVSISPATSRQRKHKNPTAPRPAPGGANAEEVEEEEEEEEEENVYINRPAELSSGQTSSEDSGDVPRNRTPAPAGDSGGSTLEVKVPDFEVLHERTDEDEAEAEGAEVSFIPQGHFTGEGEEEEDKEEEEEEEEEAVCDSSGDVNLLSVTLAALTACEEEEEQNTTDDLEPLLLLLLHTESQTESQDRTAAPPARQDFTETRTETLSGCLRTCEEEEEEEDEEDEEDEEEFSGYMKHT
ncbi:uncharacterized protein ABDE67_011240 [Symphorus nematophorus]